MRLLLTSNGIANKSIAKVLRGWVKDIRFAFIPTAANMVDGDKHWLITDLVNCRKLGPVDIVDIAAVGKKTWLPRLKKANIIVVGGGDTKYLMSWMSKSGLKKELPRLLKTRVYMGISAGSIITGKTLNASSEFLYDTKYGARVAGLGLVDFAVRPHLNSPSFPKVKDKVLKKLCLKFDCTLYAIDDETAIKVEHGKPSVVSEGKWILYPKRRLTEKRLTEFETKIRVKKFTRKNLRF
jgi:dipeptidase E